MLTIRELQIGLLEMIMYLMGIIAVVAAVAWKWDLFLLLALILTALPFLTFWEIRNLEQGNDPSRRPRQTIAKEGSVSQGQTLGRPVTTETEHNRVNTFRYPNDRAIELKGTPYDSVEFGKA